MSVDEIRARLHKLGNKQKARFLQRFFKTGPGEYGEGDLFLGVSVPELRKLAKHNHPLTTQEALQLLQSPIHEERVLALLLLIHIYSRGDEPTQEQIHELYLENTKHINSWDLVDISAPHIVGDFLMHKSKRPLYVLARSSNLWERRVAIMATAHFIRQHQFGETLKVSEALLADQEDLIQKAVGWMLREVGKRDLASAEGFLRKHYQQMPRTMLRYAIERFPEPKRQKYLKGEI